MPDIFEGIKKMSDEDIKIQIALFENVNLLNAAKETGTRVIGSLAGLANSFAETLGRKTAFEYEVTRVSDRVRDAMSGMAGKDRIQLMYELKNQIALKCGLPAEQLEELSDRRLSFLMLSEAAKSYHIQKYATPANKIEALSIQYKELFLNSLHNRLVKQDKQQAAQCDQQIQLRLNAVSMETKRELQQALLPKEFSGKGIGRILRLERGTKYLSETITYLGTGCFDEIQCHVETVLHALRSLKKVSRVLLAELVFKAHAAYGESFTINKDLLPSYIPADKAPDYNREEKAFRMLMQQRITAKEQLEQCEQALARQDDQIAQAQEKLSLEQREYDEAQMAFMGLESRKEQYVSGQRPESETRTYYSEVNEAKRNLDRMEAARDKQQRRVSDLTEQKKKLVTECNTARLNFEVIKHKSDEQVHVLADAIRRQWQAYYFGFTFENEVFEQTAVDFTAQERLDIEELLKEIHDSKEPQAYESAPDKIYGCTSGGKNFVITMTLMCVRKIERMR